MFPVTGVTLAWFTAETDPLVNEFTSGTVEIMAEQTLYTPEAVLENWNPGDCTAKEYTVINTGSKSIYLRGIITGQWYESDKVTIWTPDPDENVVYWELCNLNSCINWLRDGDYWYYSAVIPGTYGQAGEEERTKTLYLNLCLDGYRTDNRYQGKVFKLNVSFEAVQSSNNAIEDVWQLGCDNYFESLALRKNSEALISELENLTTKIELPTINSGTSVQNRNNMRDILIETDMVIKNPFKGCELILSTGQAGSNDCAAVMISQRDVAMETAIGNMNSHLWPYNAAESSREKFIGTVVLQICKDGYLIYPYPYCEGVHEFFKLPYAS